MIWLQENWVIAVVGLVVAVVLLWWLFGRAKPAEIAPPTAEPVKPAKPLEPVRPEIVAAEPARFKPVEPKLQPAAPPAPLPADTAPPPATAPAPTPAAEAQPPKPATKPKAAAKPTAKKTAPAKEPAKATAKKAAAKPAADAAAIPSEPTVPPPPAPAAPATKADNLQLLKGVGPKLVVLLNSLGVTSFRQIAEWTDADVARVDAQLGAFQGRIARDNLIDQAGYLARGDKAGFEAKYGALGGEL